MKMKLLLAAFVGSAVLLGHSLATAEDKEKSDFECKCPVSGKAVDKDATVTVAGGKSVAFCCQNCVKAFKADKDKFAARAALQLLGTGQITQIACPFSGKPVNPDAVAMIDGAEVGFCCNNCKGKAEKDQDAVALIFKDLDKGFTLQTECPVSGKPIKADAVVEHDGKKVFFCCPGCPGAFEKDPAKYTAKLPQFQDDSETK